MVIGQEIKQLNGKHVALALIGFFAVVFGMNGVFLAAALRTNTGVVAVEPYRKGLDYNRRIEAEARQQALGWTGEASFDHTRLSIQFRSADGTPLSDLAVQATIGRPATMAENVSLTLNEHEPGTYIAQDAEPGRGAFIADIVAEDRRGNVFKLRRRLWLTP